MARTIYQRIALEGGKGIADELRKIGKDGEAAFVEIRGAAAKLSKDLGALGGAFKNLGGSLATVGKRLGIAGAAAVGAAAGVVALAKSGTDLADAANKQAQALGLAIDEYGRLSFAASQSGVDAGTFGTAITRLNQEIGKAADGNKAAVAKFQELGISIRGAGGRIKPTEQLIQELANRFAQLPDGAEKSALATELFGRAGAQLLPLLNGGAEGIRNLGDEATRLGIVFSKEQAVIAEGMNDALEALSAGVSGTRAQIGLLFAPTITDAARGLQKLIEDNRIAITEFVERGIERALPLVQDFIAVIQGRDADVGSIWVLKATVLYLKFSIAIEKAVKEIIIPAFRLLIDAADTVAEAFNKVFGTDFTGQQLLIAAAIAKVLGLFGVLAAAITVVGTAFTALKTAFGFLSLLTQSGIAFSILTGIVKGLGVALGALVSIPGLIIAALVAAAVAIYVYWDEVSAAAGAAWEFIKGVWNAAPQFFNSIFASAGNFVAEQFNAIGTSVSAVWETIKQGGTAALEGIKAAFSGAGEFLNTVFIAAANAVAEALQGIATAAAGIWQDVSTTATAAIAGLVESANALWASIATSAQNQLAGLVQIFSNLNASLAVVWEAIRNGASSVFSFIRDGFTNVVSFVGNLFDGLANRIERVWNRIKSIIASAKAQYNQINDNNTGTSSQREGVGSFATGGMVRGPGTGTSDSILARLSDGEFVVKAAAVRKYGPQFLAAINSLRFKMPKFASGGLVSMPKMPQFNMGGLVDSLTTGMQYQVPRFADGGMVAIPAQAQGRPVTLNIDGRTFDGLTASEKTAEDLSRYATNRRLKSAGRKPGWVGG